MQKETTFFLTKLFLPFALLLSFMSIAALFAQQLGSVAEAELIAAGKSPAFKAWSVLAGIPIFALLIALVRKTSFQTLFLYGLGVIGILLIASMFTFSQTVPAYFIPAIVCTQLLPLLAWASINQIATRLEGMRYYFAINCVAGLLIAPTLFIPWERLSESATYMHFLLFGIAFFLTASWLVHRWIHLTLAGAGREEDTTVLSSTQWPLILSLAVIAAAIKIATLLSNSLFKDTLQQSTSLPEYTATMAQHASLLGAGVLLFLFVSIFIGPLLLQAKGWCFTVLIAPLIAALSIFAITIDLQPQFFTLQQVILRGLQLAWIIPLIQIAFLSLPKTNRFLVQAWVFLVIAPLLELPFRFISLGQAATAIVSLIIFAVMTGTAIAMSRASK